VQAPSFERVEDLLRATLEARGVTFLPVPHDGVTYGRWGPTLLDGHPNFICFLRRPTAEASRLEIIGWAPQPTTLIAVDPGDRELCRVTFTLPVAAYGCPIGADAGSPLLFVHLLPESPLDPNRLPVIKRVSVKPLPPGQGTGPPSPR